MAVEKKGVPNVSDGKKHKKSLLLDDGLFEEMFEVYSLRRGIGQ